VAQLSEWLQIMVEEIARKQQEALCAAEEEQRRRAAPAAASTSLEPASIAAPERMAAL
jgi:hypothetical protein